MLEGDQLPESVNKRCSQSPGTGSRMQERWEQHTDTFHP